MNDDLQRRVTSPPTTSLSAAETACRDVVRSVYDAIDSGRASDAVVSYTEDAVLETSRGRMAGIEAIAAAMAARQANTGRVTRHVLTDVSVTTADETETRVTATLFVYVLSGPSPTDPEITSALDIRLSPHDGAWRIHHHSSTRLADGDAR